MGLFVLGDMHVSLCYMVICLLLGVLGIDCVDVDVDVYIHVCSDLVVTIFFCWIIT